MEICSPAGAWRCCKANNWPDTVGMDQRPSKSPMSTFGNTDNHLLPLANVSMPVGM